MAQNSKNFLVSTADVAYYHNGKLAFTGTSAINTSLSVSMEDQEILGGKGNKTLYKFKYGRKLSASIEMAEWNLAYIASQVGSTIAEELSNVYSVAECVTLKNGLGVLAHEVVAGEKVFVEKPDGTTEEVTATKANITVPGGANETVKCTYKYSTNVKSVTIDADATPLVGELIMTVDRHNNLKGKVGETQIIIPSFQLSGTFDISLEASGSTTTKMDGDALAVEGDSCKDGAVYAYIKEISDVASVASVVDIAVTPATMTLKVQETQPLTIVGLKSGLYSNVIVDAKDCEITSDKQNFAKVVGGVVTGVAAGEATITVTYNGKKDFVKVTVTA